MDKSYLNRGIICVLVGICFILAAVFTESALDGLLWGLAGGVLGPGIGMIIILYLYGLMVFQIAAGVAAYKYLRKKY